MKHPPTRTSRTPIPPHGVRYAYGDSSDDPRGCVLHDPPCPPGWAGLDRTQREIADLDTDAADSRQYYLNQPSAAELAWLSAQQWAACAAPETWPNRRPSVACRRWRYRGGFDDRDHGRIRRFTSTPPGRDRRHRDRVRHPRRACLRTLRWRDDLAGPPGTRRLRLGSPVAEVDAAMREVLAPTTSSAATAIRTSGKGSSPAGKAVRSPRPGAGQREHPFTYWPTGRRFTSAVEAFRQAVIGGELTHDDNPLLTGHVLNARQRNNSYGTPSRRSFLPRPARSTLRWPRCSLGRPALTRSPVPGRPRPRLPRTVCGEIAEGEHARVHAAHTDDAKRWGSRSRPRVTVARLVNRVN